MAGSLEIKVISEKLAYVYGGDADGVALMQGWSQNGDFFIVRGGQSYKFM